MRSNEWVRQAVQTAMRGEELLSSPEPMLTLSVDCRQFEELKGLRKPTQTPHKLWENWPMLTSQPAATPHIPVLLQDVMHALSPIEGRVFLDGTFGAGGYTRAILGSRAERVVAVDRDPTAIEAGRAMQQEYDGRLLLVEGRFGELDRHAMLHIGKGGVDGVVLDIGVSSMQLDRAERGFSFRADGPLDMRMAAQGPSAADIVNAYDQRALAQIFYVLGEEKKSRQIAAAIVKRRTDQPFHSTLELANLIEATIGRRPGDKIHPATRSFQALRIFVNDELGELVRALGAAERALRSGGRLVVVTFHSLEDRIVKRFLAERSGAQAAGSRHLPRAEVDEPTFELLSKKPVEASEEECWHNPRARSARLRAARRLQTRSRSVDTKAVGLPDLGFRLNED